MKTEYADAWDRLKTDSKTFKEDIKEACRKAWPGGNTSMKTKRSEYLQLLRKELKAIGCRDIRGVLDYVNEMIDDSMEAGLSEEEAIWNLPYPRRAAKEFSGIYTEMPADEKTRIKRTSSGPRNPILLLLTFPLWFTLITLWFVGAVLVFTFVMLTIILPVAFFAAGISSFVTSVLAFISYGPAAGFIALGVGVACIGLGILFACLVSLAFKGFGKYCKSGGKLFKWIFVKKGKGE